MCSFAFMYLFYAVKAIKNDLWGAAFFYFFLVSAILYAGTYFWYFWKTKKC